MRTTTRELKRRSAVDPLRFNRGSAASDLRVATVEAQWIDYLVIRGTSRRGNGSMRDYLVTEDKK